MRKLRLQQPNLPHRRRITLRHAPAALHIVAQAVHRRAHRRSRPRATPHFSLPTPVHILPKQRRQHKPHRHRFARPQPRIRLLQSQQPNMLRPAIRRPQHRREQRMHRLRQAQPPQGSQAARRIARQQNFQQFIKQPRHRLMPQQQPHLPNRRRRCRLHRKAQFPRQARRPQHPHRVFLITLRRIANHHQAPRRHILPAAVKIQHLLRRHIVIQRIAGEITPHRILLQRAIRVIPHNPPARILHHPPAAAKRAHLNRLAALHHMHNLKPPPDNPAAAKQTMHLLGRGAGCHIKILRLDAQQQIAHRTAHQIRLKPRPMQALQHPQSRLIAHSQLHRMAHAMHLARRAFFRQHPLYQIFKHTNFLKPQGSLKPSLPKSLKHTMERRRLADKDGLQYALPPSKKPLGKDFRQPEIH